MKVSDLIFDIANPRLPQNLQGVSDEKKVIEYMIKFGNVTELMYSIVETGYSDAEPLLIVGSANEKYTVVEGNRRLAALKLLNNPQLAKVKVSIISEIVSNASVEIPSEVPCIIYDNRDEILDYLGYRHITGVKDWGALEKARYLDILYKNHVNDSNITDIYKKLAKMIGSKSDYVKKLHLAYKLYMKANDESYYGYSVTDEDINFSWITASLGYTEVQKYLGIDDGKLDIEKLNEENYKMFFGWMFDSKKGVVDESRSIPKLASVLSSEEAIEKLKKSQNLDEAVLFTDQPEKVFIELLTKAKTNMTQAKMAIEQLSGKPEEAMDLLEDIVKLQRTIVGALKENFDDTDPEISQEALKKLLEQLTQK